MTEVLERPSERLADAMAEPRSRAGDRAESIASAG